MLLFLLKKNSSLQALTNKLADKYVLTIEIQQPWIYKKKKPFSSDLLSECTPNVLIQSTFKHPEKKIKTNLLKRGYSNKEVTDQLMMVGKLNCCILMFYRENPTNATVFRLCWTVLEDCQIFTIQIKMVKKNFFDCNSSNFIKCDKATYTFEDRGWCIKYMFKLNITD